MENPNILGKIIHYVYLGYEVSFRKEMYHLTIEMSKSTWVDGKETRSKMSQMIPLEYVEQIPAVLSYIEEILSKEALKLVNNSCKPKEE